MDQRVALITGGSKGLGFAMGQKFAESGAEIALAARSTDEVMQAANQIQQSTGQKTKGYTCDVSSAAALSQLHTAVIDDFGHIDILINNAGFAKAGAFEDISDDEWQYDLDLKLMAAVRLSRLVLPEMKKNRWGRIINISSVEGSGANKKNVSHYITFKHAMNGFTKATAFEYGDQGITVNAISPGAIETDLMIESGPAAAETMGITYEAFKETYAAESAIKRLNTVEEVASLALFLTGDLAGGITGGILPVDGGTGL